MDHEYIRINHHVMGIDDNKRHYQSLTAVSCPILVRLGIVLGCGIFLHLDIYRVYVSMGFVTVWPGRKCVFSPYYNDNRTTWTLRGNNAEATH